MDDIDISTVGVGRYQALLDIEKRARALVEGMEKFPDASAQLLGLKAVLKPTEPEYVPLVDDGMVNDIMAHDEPRSRRELVQEVVAEALRKAADRLEAEELRERSEANAVVLLRRWADAEEKYNA